MSWRGKLITGFTNWERDARLARDRAIAKEEDPDKQRVIRQIWNIKIATMAAATNAINEFDETDDKGGALVKVKH